jgi:benzil reductase ((S)-benzoin forming)
MDTLVVVTGGSTGLGAALLATAPAGARLVDVSRSGPPPGDREVTHVPADLAEPRAWREVGAAIAKQVAAVRDRVVFWHAAGTIEPIGFAGEVDADAYTRNVLLNAACGQVLGARVLAAMAASPAERGEVCLVSSGAARRAYPGWSAYGAGKAALDHWARTVHEEQALRGGTRVLSVAPGVVATAMQETIRATDARDFPHLDRFRELHRRGDLEDPRGVAVRLWALLDEPDLPPVVDLRDHR